MLQQPLPLSSDCAAGESPCIQARLNAGLDCPAANHCCCCCCCSLLHLVIKRDARTLRQCAGRVRSCVCRYTVLRQQQQRRAGACFRDVGVAVVVELRGCVGVARDHAAQYELIHPTQRIQPGHASCGGQPKPTRCAGAVCVVVTCVPSSCWVALKQAHTHCQRHMAQQVLKAYKRCYIDPLLGVSYITLLLRWCNLFAMHHAAAFKVFRDNTQLI